MKTAIALLGLVLAGAPAAGENRDMPTIEEVKARHAERLLELPAVVSVGIGRDPDGQPVIVVGLDRKRPETEQALPAEIENYPVRIKIIGAPKAQ